MPDDRRDRVPPEPAIRKMRPQDLDRVVAIDARVFGQRRPDYYRRRLARALDETQQLVTSLVIEVEGELAGFVMGQVYLGEFGVPETTGTIDTIGIDPDYQGRGVATTLFNEYASHLRRIGVSWNDWRLLRFFEKVGFEPADVITLELALQ